MPAKNKYEEQLEILIKDFFITQSKKPLYDFLSMESNLPGPRGNLELAFAFSDVVQKHANDHAEALWSLCVMTSGISPAIAPVNTPDEFLPFCGTVGIGAVASISPTFLEQAMSLLKKLANDPRWRTREAVTMALVRLIYRQPEKITIELLHWTIDGTLLETRAATAGIADPGVLKDNAVAEKAVEIHKEAAKRILIAPDRKADEFKTLRKALGFTFSVVAVAKPDEIFALLHQLTESGDKDAIWIVKENLQKKRLEKFADQIEMLQQKIRSHSA